LVDVDSYVVFAKARTLQRQPLLPCAGNGRWDPLRKVGWRLIPIANYPLEICILYVYIEEIDIVWDPEKARSNLKKHGVRFSDAEIVLSDPNALQWRIPAPKMNKGLSLWEQIPSAVSSWWSMHIVVKIYD
jgi:hypothetical protein